VRACFDSAILIDYLNGVNAASAAIRNVEDRLISVLTWIEVMAGVRTESETKGAAALLQLFTVVDVGLEVADLAAAIRRERRLKLADAVILATARRMDCPLVTRNTKDFRAGDPGILVPYTV
jgi:predicted nucleic acid-binding protein